MRPETERRLAGAIISIMVIIFIVASYFISRAEDELRQTHRRKCLSGIYSPCNGHCRTFVSVLRGEECRDK